MFYRSTIEIILSYCISSWFGNSMAEERHKLKRIVRTGEKIIDGSLPDIHTECFVRRADSINKDTIISWHVCTRAVQEKIQKYLIKGLHGC